MSYYNNTDPVHSLNVTGKITPEAARVLVDTQEKITQLGFRCTLVLSIQETATDAPDKVESAV